MLHNLIPFSICKARDYIKIGLSIRRILNEYADKWKSEKK